MFKKFQDPDNVSDHSRNGIISGVISLCPRADLSWTFTKKLFFSFWDILITHRPQTDKLSKNINSLLEVIRMHWKSTIYRCPWRPNGDVALGKTWELEDLCVNQEVWGALSDRPKPDTVNLLQNKIELVFWLARSVSIVPQNVLDVFHYQIQCSLQRRF